jgi:hypothetical protein
VLPVAATTAERDRMSAELQSRGLVVAEPEDTGGNLDQVAVALAYAGGPDVWAICVPPDWRRDVPARAAALLAWTTGKPILELPYLTPVRIAGETEDAIMLRRETEDSVRRAIGVAADAAARLVNQVEEHAQAAVEDDRSIVVPAGIAASVCASLTSTLAALRNIDHGRDDQGAQSILQVFGLGGT